MKRRFVSNRLMLMMTAGMLVFSTVKIPAMAMEDGELPAIEYSGEGEDHVYTAPTNIRWDDEVPGRALFEATDPTEGVLIVRLYKDGSQAGGGTVKCDGAKAYSHNLSKWIHESGTYTFKVKHTSKMADFDMDTGAVSEESEDFVYVQPTETIGIVSNPHWSADKPGVAEWDAVEHAYEYQVNMEVIGQNLVYVKDVAAPATSFDFSNEIAKYPDKGFRFYVYAWSSDITKWGNTTTSSELSEEYYPGAAKRNKIEDFVKRIYKVGLGREAEEEGLKNWSDKLASGEKKAVDIVQGVLCSPEYLGKDKSNGDMVTDCYKAMLGREPDKEGYDGWVSRLDAGMSINAIFAGFVESTEFATLCGQYEISPGTYPITEERDKNAGVTMFVSRLYTEALDRDYDTDGLNDWCGRINADPSKDNIMNVATNGFFHSAEFKGKDLSNKDFVKVLYRTFLGREYDEDGLKDWVGKLDRGEKTRDEVMEGFAYSPEFSNIMASYGL